MNDEVREEQRDESRIKRKQKVKKNRVFEEKERAKVEKFKNNLLR